MIGNLEARIVGSEEEIAVIGSIESTPDGVAISVGFTDDDEGWVKTHHLALTVSETLRLINKLTDAVAKHPSVERPQHGLGLW